MILLRSKGYTLIEMVMVIVILSIVCGITIHFLANSLKIYAMTVNQKTLLDEGKLALERICRDIRDARAIASPAAGGSGNLVTFTRTHSTAQDLASETITFRLNGITLEKAKASPMVTSAMAANVSAFLVSRSASDEITIQLTLSLASGENVTLQTKVYPKNLAESTIYKTFFSNWQEEWST